MYGYYLKQHFDTYKQFDQWYVTTYSQGSIFYLLTTLDTYKQLWTHINNFDTYKQL